MEHNTRHPWLRSPPCTKPATDCPETRLAADAGDAQAKYNLAVRLSSGNGVSKDQKAAVRYMMDAATAGLPHALYNMGVFHFAGEGVKQDHAVAAKFFEAAAKQGFAAAAVNLANMYL